MLKNNIAIITSNSDNILELTSIIPEDTSHIYKYNTIEDLKNKPENINIDTTFCYLDEIKDITELKNIEKIFIIDTEFKLENKKLAYDNFIYEYIHKPLNTMDIIHKLKIINKQKVEIYNSNSSCISILSQLINIKDGGNNGHLIRIRNLVGLFLEELIEHKDYKDILSESLCYNITQATLLHDIGKMLIPDDILYKPGTLNFDEFEIMRRHSAMGAEILRKTYEKFQANKIIKIAIDISESHHERWDGNGYPNKLKGDRIPLFARIVAICDVYDTIISENPYKNSSTHNHALETIILESNNRFDPKLVEIFKSIENAITSGKQSRFSKMKIDNKNLNI